MNFERGQDPKKAIGIGILLPNARILNSKAPETSLKLIQKYINIANRSNKSIGFRKYIKWWASGGGWDVKTPKSQVMFEIWLTTVGVLISTKEIIEAANDNWPNSNHKFKKEISKWIVVLKREIT